MPFKHNFDGHLGESLRKRPGPRMTLALAFVLALVVSPHAAAPAAPRTVARPARALPDSVLVRLPHKDLTHREVLEAWHKLPPQYRPAGAGVARTRAFLDQLVEKEAVARAALAEPFVMTDIESAQFQAGRADAVRRMLYRRMVLDSVTVTPADFDSARARMAPAADGKPIPPEGLASTARSFAEARRAALVNDRIKASLIPVWDDSVTVLLARGYATLDPSTPDLSNPMALRLKNRNPPLAPADTGRVLATSAAGPITAGGFVRRFSMLNPFDNPLPTTPGAVQARAEQFLGQMWFDREADRQDLLRDPQVLATLATRRESIALDHYFARHVLAKIDTSEAKLRVRFAKTPARYAAPGHSLVSNFVVPTRGAADSVLAQLKTGTPWDTLCARAQPADAERGACAQTMSLPDSYPDSVLVRHVKQLAPGGVMAYPLPDPSGGVAMIRLSERVPFRRRTFEEARAFVARDLANEQTEVILKAELARLKRGMPVTRNEAALARLDLDPDL